MVILKHRNQYKSFSLPPCCKYLTTLVLRVFICLSMLLLHISCAANLPQETYLKKKDITQISNLAVMASSNKPEVSYTDTVSPGVTIAGMGAIILFGPFFGLFTALGLQEAVKVSADNEHAQQVNSRVDLSILEDHISRTFITSLGKDGFFKNTAYVKGQDEQQLTAAGYDGVLRLTINKIALERKVADKVSLRIHVNGLMKSLKSGNILWDREEIVMSRNSYPLEYYNENGMKELNSLLEKAGRNLAYDFVYLK